MYYLIVGVSILAFYAGMASVNIFLSMKVKKSCLGYIYLYLDSEGVLQQTTLNPKTVKNWKP